MKMEIEVKGVQVQFYLDTGAEVNKDTFDHIGARSLQKCDEVALMYNGQRATFLGKGRGLFKRRDRRCRNARIPKPTQLRNYAVPRTLYR